MRVLLQVVQAIVVIMAMGKEAAILYGAYAAPRPSCRQD